MFGQNKREKKAPDDSGASSSPDGSYRYVRPESKEVLYRDAAVESTEDTVRFPRCYVPNAKTVKESRDPKEREEIPNGFFVRAACMCLVCALLGGVVGGGLTATLLYRSDKAESAPPPGNSRTDDGENSAVPPPPVFDEHYTPAAVLQGDSTMSSAEIYNMACQQVVGITTEVTYKNFFGQTSSSAVTGSGFIISTDGDIMTNYHVIEYADQYGYDVQVMMHDGTVYNATIAGTEEDNDIAVLQIQATGLDAVSLGNSDAINVGDTVQAVGNPLGELDFTMTFGQVTALDRRITTGDSAPAINMFQIDAAVNKGNSGGPVYDSAGNVIGVVTAKYSDTGIEGIGFAIPINDAMSIANELITNGYVTGKPYLGISVVTMSYSAAQYYNSTEGAYIYSVAKDSPAEFAGLKAGDVVYQLGDQDVFTEEDLRVSLRNYRAGDTVSLGVFRAGEGLSLTVTLGEAAPEQTGETTPEQSSIEFQEDAA